MLSALCLLFFVIFITWLMKDMYCDMKKIEIMLLHYFQQIINKKSFEYRRKKYIKDNSSLIKFFQIGQYYNNRLVQ